jgi:hypothetical protein
VVQQVLHSSKSVCLSVCCQVHVAQRGITARKVVQQVLHSLRRLGDVVRGVLPPREFVLLASSVLQALAERAIGEGTDSHRKCSKRSRNA